MNASVPEYSFLAPILRMEDGMRHHYVPLPEDIAGELQSEGVRRVIGTLNGNPIDRAVHRFKDGRRYLMIGKASLSHMRLRFGELVEVIIRADPDPDSIPLCAELVEVLRQDSDASDRFERLSPGLRRSLAFYVNGARRLDTRIRRALYMANKLKTDPSLRDR